LSQVFFHRNGVQGDRLAVTNLFCILARAQEMKMEAAVKLNRNASSAAQAGPSE